MKQYIYFHKSLINIGFKIPFTEIGWKLRWTNYEGWTVYKLGRDTWHTLVWYHVRDL